MYMILLIYVIKNGYWYSSYGSSYSLKRQQIKSEFVKYQFRENDSKKEREEDK